MLASQAGAPPLGLVPFAPRAQRVAGLEIAVRLLGREDLGNPVLQRRLQLLLGLEDLGIALRIDHQRDADRLDGLVDPCVGKRVSNVRLVGLAAEFLGGLG